MQALESAAIPCRLPSVQLTVRFTWRTPDDFSSNYAFFAPTTCPTRFHLPTPIHPRDVGRDGLWGVGAGLEGQPPNWFVSCLLLFRNFCARLHVWSFAHLLRLHSLRLSFLAISAEPNPQECKIQEVKQPHSGLRGGSLRRTPICHLADGLEWATAEE